MPSRTEANARSWLDTSIDDLLKRTPTILPDNTIVDEPPERYFTLLKAGFQPRFDVNRHASRRVLSLLDEHRVQRGEQKHGELTRLLDQLLHFIVITEADGGVNCIDWAPDTIAQLHGLERPERRVAERVRAFLSDASNAHQYPLRIVAPPPIAFDAFDTRGLERLIDPATYLPSERRENAYRSSNVVRRGTPYQFKATTSLLLGADAELYVDLKCILYGTKHAGTRDKMDVVLRMGARGVRDILHVEYNSGASIRQFYDRFGVEMSGPGVSSAIRQDVFGQTGSQFKTDTRTGVRFSHILFDGEERHRKDLNINAVANYDELCRDPFLLGGPALETAVGFVCANYDRLTDLYARLRAGN